MPQGAVCLRESHLPSLPCSQAQGTALHERNSPAPDCSWTVGLGHLWASGFLGHLPLLVSDYTEWAVLPSTVNLREAPCLSCSLRSWRCTPYSLQYSAETELSNDGVQMAVQSPLGCCLLHLSPCSRVWRASLPMFTGTAGMSLLCW